MASVTKFWISRISRWRLKAAVSGRKDQYRILAADTSEAKAEALRLAWLGEIETGQENDSGHSGRERFGAFLESLATNRAHLAASTQGRYGELRRRIGPLGDKRLAAITLADATELTRRLLAEGLHPATVGMVYDHAHRGLKEAAHIGVLPADPWRKGRRVQQPRPNRQMPAPADIIRRIGQIPGRTGTLLRLAYCSGCRRGELLGLTWADIEAGRLRVQRGLEVARDGGVLVSPPKTDSSHRTVALPAFILNELAALRLEAATRALAAGLELGGLPVLPGDGGGWWHPVAASKASARALRRVGLPVSLHTMRHAYATALLADGVNPRQVQAMLGHAHIETTLAIYGHTIARDDQRAVEAISATLPAGPPALELLEPGK
jgi:integrase